MWHNLDARPCNRRCRRPHLQTRAGRADIEHPDMARPCQGKYDHTALTGKPSRSLGRTRHMPRGRGRGQFASIFHVYPASQRCRQRPGKGIPRSVAADNLHLLRRDGKYPRHMIAGDQPVRPRRNDHCLELAAKVHRSRPRSFKIRYRPGAHHLGLDCIDNKHIDQACQIGAKRAKGCCIQDSANPAASGDHGRRKVHSFGDFILHSQNADIRPDIL